jgi:hypothetical protein
MFPLQRHAIPCTAILAVRGQLVSILAAMRPSDNIMNGVEALAADSTYGAKLADINQQSRALG